MLKYENMDEAAKKEILEGVLKAGALLRQQFQSSTSSDMSKVTAFDYGIQADKDSEEILLKAVKDSGMNCQIIAEESGVTENPDADYTVYIDPLDGTVNFSRGIPFFCIGLAIFKNEEPLLGIVYDPCMNELFVGEKDKGVTLNGKKIDPVIRQENMLINLEWFGADDYENVVKKLKSSSIRARSAGSGVLAITYGAIGRGDGSIALQNKPWDVAPGLVFSKELGLRVEQLNGSKINLNEKQISMISAPNEIFDKIKTAIVS